MVDVALFKMDVQHVTALELIMMDNFVNRQNVIQDSASTMDVA